MGNTKQKILTTEEVRRKGSRYLLEELGNRLWAGVPAFDEARQQWTVSIHSHSVRPEVELGKLVLNPDGEVVRAPSRSAVRRVLRQYQPSSRR